MTGRSIELKGLLSETKIFNYNSMYKALSHWVVLGLIIKEEEQNRLPGGIKIRYKITPKGKKCFQEIADIMFDVGNVNISRDKSSHLLEAVENKIKKDAADVIKAGMRTYSGIRLQEYFIKELIVLFQNSIYDIFDKYFIVPKV